MAKKSVIKSMTPPESLSANLWFHFTNGRLLFDADAWAEALPSGRKGKAVDLTTTYTEETWGRPDFSMEVGLKLKGDFSKSDGVWGGTVKNAIFQIDGETVGVIKINSGVDLGRIVDVGPSGLIWNELTQTGLRGKLTKAADNLNGSVWDDSLNGLAGDDRIEGGLGNDKLIGGAGNDHLNGHIGDDRLIGGAGNDFLDGRSGSDRALGQAGKDVFFADAEGANLWTGGKGADLFQPGAWFGEENVSTTVTDFSKRQGDQIDLSNDSFLLFYFAEVDEIRYIGKKDFTGTDGRFEIRMENGFVEIDQNGDRRADRGIHLDGLDTFAKADTSWILLPDGFDFG